MLYCMDNTCGVGLVVEYVLAKDETRVRFPYAAHKSSKLCYNIYMQSLKKYLFIIIIILLVAIGLYVYFIFGNQMRASRAETKSADYASKMYADYFVIGHSCQGEDTNGDGYVTCNIRIKSKESGAEKTLTLQCPTYIKSFMATNCKEQGIVINQQ